MDITLFPYALIRYPGLDYKALDALRCVHLMKQADLYNRFTTSIQENKMAFCDKLYDVISLLQDDNERQKLINLKRKIYNEKQLTPHDAEFLAAVLPFDSLKLFNSFSTEVQHLQLFVSDGQQSFDRLLQNQRKLLQRLTESETFQNGLLQSSPVIYEELTRFRAQSPYKGSQKQLRMEFSVMKYLTRMAFKTSPFSTFTYTGLGIFGDKCDSGGQDGRLTSTVRLNNTLFNYLEALIKRHPKLVGCLIVQLNETITIEHDRICFLLNYLNIEAFQKINNNGINEKIISILQEFPYGINFNDLFEKLASFLDEDQRPSLKAYLLKLNASGLFKMGFNISGIAPDWDIKLTEYLKRIAPNYPEVSRIVILLETLQRHKASYPAASTNERHRILALSEMEVNAVFSDLQNEAGISFPDVNVLKELPLPNGNEFFGEQFRAYRFESKHIFFEDCATDKLAILPTLALREFMIKVDRLLNGIRPFDRMAGERRKMCNFYLKHYAPDADVRLYDFYKMYYALVKKPEKLLLENGGEADISGEMKGWESLLETTLKTILKPLTEEINIPANFFDQFDSTVTPAYYSRGIFGQFFRNDTEDIIGVLNAVLPGMGKVAGRFLPLFDVSVGTLQAEWNQQIFPDILKIELSDNSSFNANIHPPLLTRELALPGSNNLYPEPQQIHLNELTIRFNAKIGRLELFYKDQHVYAYDLSLESFYNRSNLYQMLAHFNAESRPGVDQLVKLIDSLIVKDRPLANVVLLPRISFDETVIIRRKCWFIQTSCIPVQQIAEPEYEYFLRLNSWRLRERLPCRIFLFLRKRVAMSETEETAGQADDYKPQYISFETPLTIIMFKRLIKRAGSHLWFEEMLPDPFTNKNLHNDNEISEYLIQWYNVKS